MIDKDEEFESVLRKIDGIGPAFARKLEGEGVGLRELAEANEDDLDRWDMKLGLRGKPREQNWRQQAIDLLSNAPELGEAAITEALINTPEWRYQAEKRDDEMGGPPADFAYVEMVKWEALKAENEKLKAAMLTADRKAPVSTDAPRGRRPRRLNRNRKFSDIYGSDEEHPGAGYMQVIEGEMVYFDHSGVEIGEGLAGDPEAERQAKEIEDVHFENYMDGKQQYPFDLLLKAIRFRWKNAKVRNEKDAKGFLHDQLRTNQ